MKDKYYPSLDALTKLSMTTFGKIKLSIIPEGVTHAVYNYFKSSEKFPSYDDFFNSCVHQCKTQKLEIQSRFDAFYEFCKKHNLDHQNTPTSYIPIIPEAQAIDIEAEFWKTEKFKLTPDGIACIYKNGDVLNPFKNKMIALTHHKHPKLFALYEKSSNSYEDNKIYLNALKEASL